MFDPVNDPTPIPLTDDQARMLGIVGLVSLGVSISLWTLWRWESFRGMSAKPIRQLLGAVGEEVATVLFLTVYLPINALGVLLVVGMLVVTKTAWIAILGGPLVALALFRLRKASRLSYGVAEIVFGYASILSVMLPQHQSVFAWMEHGATWPVVRDQWVRIAGGIYVMIRGLDNITKGHSAIENTRTWKLLFGSSPERTE